MKELPSDPLLDFVLQVFHQPQKVDAVYHYLLARDSLGVISNLPVEREYFEVTDGWFDEAVFIKAVSNHELCQREAEMDLDVATTKMEGLGVSAKAVDELSLNYIVFPDLINDLKYSPTTNKTPRERYIEKKQQENVFSHAANWIKSFKGPKRSR